MLDCSILILEIPKHILTVAPHLAPEVFEKPSIRHPIAVSLGAIAGALSRYYLSLCLAKVFTPNFPYATIFVNLSGSFFMGLFITLLLKRTLIISAELRLLIAIGFLGSYTTFSSYELDVISLFRRHTWQLAFAYWLLSAICGFVCLYLGVVVAKLVK
ncbi:MAG: hypothetical protein Tsb0014_35560 [Pleurocapsa sp.]